MFHRKDAVSMAVVGLLASCGLAMADTTVKSPALSLDSTVVTAQDTGAPSGLIMQGLDKVGAAKPLQNLGINIYGWVEAGYSANLRNNEGTGRNGLTRPPGFSEEIGGHVILNQVAIRIEKLVDAKKFDVGGLIEASFGDDMNFTEPNGIEYQTPGDNPGEVPHFDFTQAYVDVNLPVGNGLKVRAGHFYTLIGYEVIDPRGNPLYTHSLLFATEPLTNTGVVAFYTLNDQWAFAGGVTRGFNQATEDVNGSPDGVGQVTYTPNKQWQFILTSEVGPQEFDDTSHYDFMVNPIVTYQATDKLKLAAEGIYDYDGGFNADFRGFSQQAEAASPNAITSGGRRFSHAYGDDYGVALYGSYVVNDYVTANARAEWLHTYFGAGVSNGSFNFGGIPTINIIELTLGVTITPMPKDPIFQNLSIRPEIRYDGSEDKVFVAGHNNFRDQYTVAADVIMKF